jgi:hydroxyacylglutathione hydrolase
MILERFYDDKLAQASWLVGCAATGEALVVDPHRDVEVYVSAAVAEGLRITHVTETHIHADFVSGARELAAATGARLYLSDEGGPDWRYAFAADDGAVLLRDGDTFMVGNVRIEAMHTPGHTPEHLSFIVTDTAGADRPMGAFTGDFVFVGDVGRPDLLEKAAKVMGTMEAGARTLFRSLQAFKAELPDFVQVWPGHGAGSACGKALGAVPQSTLGYERLFNWGLVEDDEEAFVRAVLAGQPEPPKYFAEMKRINREGPRVLGGFSRPRHLQEARLVELMESGALVVDTRSAADYAVEHVPGTINIPLNRSFNTWAGWLIPYDRAFYLIVDEHATAATDEAVRDLAMIGLDRVAGYFTSRAVQAWKDEGRPLASVRQITSDELAARMTEGEVNVIDVRGAAEWEAGHLPDVPNIPVGYLADRLDEVPADRPLVVHCQGGGRSAIAASVLQARGVTDVLNLTGGYQEWVRAGNPVEQGETAAVGA